MGRNEETGIQIKVTCVSKFMVNHLVLHNIATMRNSLPWTVIGGTAGTDQPGDGDEGDSDDSDEGVPPPRARRTRQDILLAGHEQRDYVVEAFFR